MTMQSSRSAITLAPRASLLDFTLPDPAFEGWDVDSVVGGGGQTPRSTRSQSYTAPPENITLQRHLARAEDEEGFGDGDLFDLDAGMGFPLDETTDLGLVVRRDSQGREVDANGDVIDEDNSSIGVARDAPSQQGGRRSSILGDITDNFGAMDAGLDLGLEEFEAQRQRSSTPANQTQSLLQDLTPRTAIKVQQAAEKRAATSEKIKKQIIDSQTELQDVSFRASKANRANLLSIIAEEQYLPRSRTYMKLLEMNANPARHLLPFLAGSGGNNLTTFAGSKGLAPQLSELFTFDTSALRRQRSPSVDLQEEDRREKRQKTDAFYGGDDTIEIGRRAEETSDLGLDRTGLGLDTTMGNFGGDEEMPFDLPAIDAETSVADLGPRRSQRKRITGGQERENAFDQQGDLPRLATPSVLSEGDGQTSVHDSPSSSNLLGAFESRVNGEATNLAAETQASTQAGMSKNTARAIKVLRKKFGNQEGDDDDEEEEAIFKDFTTTKTTRREAAGFFFELLVLATKDCIKVTQQESFGDITIQAKSALYEEEVV